MLKNMDWIHMTLDGDQIRIFVNMVINIRVPGIFLTSYATVYLLSLLVFCAVPPCGHEGKNIVVSEEHIVYILIMLTKTIERRDGTQI